MSLWYKISFLEWGKKIQSAETPLRIISQKTSCLSHNSIRLIISSISNFEMSDDEYAGDEYQQDGEYEEPVEDLEENEFTEVIFLIKTSFLKKTFLTKSNSNVSLNRGERKGKMITMI